MEPPLAQDPDFSPADSLHFYSPLIHLDSLPGWKLSLSLTIFGHFLSPLLFLFESPLLRPSFDIRLENILS